MLIGDWTSDTSMTNVLNTIYGLLFQADYSDPVYVCVLVKWGILEKLIETVGTP